MTDYKKAFVDTAPFIYFIERDENNPQYYDKIKIFFSNGYDSDKKFVTSVITMEEYFVFPYRNKRYSFIDMFKKLYHQSTVFSRRWCCFCVDGEVSGGKGMMIGISKAAFPSIWQKCSTSAGTLLLFQFVNCNTLYFLELS